MSKKIEAYLCPGCGTTMTYVGGLLDWACPYCGAVGSVDYDYVYKVYYIDLAESYSYEDIYADPIGNLPDCCYSCGGPYPGCLSSCIIFDS